MKVTFNAKDHTYRDKNGLLVPSVTTLLGEFGIIDLERMKFANSSLGSATHKACELDDRGTLDEDSLHPRVAQRLEQWRKFKKDKKSTIIINERPMISKLNFAGTPDKVILFNCFPVLIDIKSSKVRSKSTIVQLFAYKKLVEEAEPIIIGEVWEVYLGENEYKVIKHKDPDGEHWEAFKAMVQVHHYKRRNL